MVIRCNVRWRQSVTISVGCLEFSWWKTIPFRLAKCGHVSSMVAFKLFSWEQHLPDFNRLILQKEAHNSPSKQVHLRRMRTSLWIGYRWLIPFSPGRFTIHVSVFQAVFPGKLAFRKSSQGILRETVINRLTYFWVIFV